MSATRPKGMAATRPKGMAAIHIGDGRQRLLACQTRGSCRLQSGSRSSFSIVKEVVRAVLCTLINGNNDDKRLPQNWRRFPILSVNETLSTKTKTHKIMQNILPPNLKSSYWWWKFTDRKRVWKGRTITNNSFTGVGNIWSSGHIENAIHASLLDTLQFICNRL